MSLKSTLRSSDIKRARHWFHFLVGKLRASSVSLLRSRCQRWNQASVINVQPWGLLKVWGHRYLIFLRSFRSWFFFFVCGEIVSAKEVLKGDCWIGTLLCSLWSLYSSCSPGESQLWGILSGVLSFLFLLFYCNTGLQYLH